MTFLIQNRIRLSGNSSAINVVKSRVTREARVPTIARGTDGTLELNTLTKWGEFVLWNITSPAPEFHKKYTLDKQAREEWNASNWGTPSEIVQSSESKNQPAYEWRSSFVTEWSPPHAALIRLSVDFPQIIIENRWSDLGTLTTGEKTLYRGGVRKSVEYFGPLMTHKKYTSLFPSYPCVCGQPHLAHAMEPPFVDCHRGVTQTVDALDNFNRAHLQQETLVS